MLRLCSLQLPFTETENDQWTTIPLRSALYSFFTVPDRRPTRKMKRFHWNPIAPMAVSLHIFYLCYVYILKIEVLYVWTGRNLFIQRSTIMYRWCQIYQPSGLNHHTLHNSSTLTSTKICSWWHKRTLSMGVRSKLRRGWGGGWEYTLPCTENIPQCMYTVC